MNRRDLLKLFGAGSVIAPVIGGVAGQSPQVKLIEEAKVELFAPESILIEAPFPFANIFIPPGQFDVTVTLRDRNSGRVGQMECTTFMSRLETHPPYNHSFPHGEAVPRITELTLSCTGIARTMWNF